MLSAVQPTPAPRARRRALAALGVQLSQRGVLAPISLGIGVLTVLVAVAVTVGGLARDARAPLEQVPALTAGALAWGAGVLLAFAASVHALKQDRETGITALLRARGASIAGYVYSRVGGLTMLLVLVVAGGTLVAGLTATLVATRTGLALRTLQATGASLVYALAFAGTLGPLAMAALGARSRAGGYGWLLLVLVLPELIAPVTGPMMPTGWRELTSIPGALHGLRVALMPPGVDVWRAAKALFVLGLVTVACLLVVRRAARRASAEEVA